MKLQLQGTTFLPWSRGWSGPIEVGKAIPDQEVSFTERRHHARLRSIFPNAYIRMVRYFHGSRDWVEYLAQRMVHESYHELSTAEVRILVAAIEKRLVVQEPAQVGMLRLRRQALRH